MQNLKKSRFIVSALVIIALLALGSLLLKKNPNIPDWQISKNTNDSYDVSVNISKKNEDKAFYSIEADVPRFVIKNHAAISATINNQIEDYINAAIASFKEDSFDNDALPAGTSGGNPDSAEKSTLTINYSSFENVKNKFLTVEFGASSYASGAAHPLSFTHVMNFNLADGKLVGLNDLFSVDEKQYLEKISKYSKEKLRENMIKALSLSDDGAQSSDKMSSSSVDVLEGVFFEEGADPLSQNYSEFKIKPDGLEFIFGQYQVAPYVMGEQRVLVPYAEIKDLLRV